MPHRYQMGSLYINELMVKKLSLFGAVGLLLAHKWQTERKKNAMVRDAPPQPYQPSPHCECAVQID